MARKKRSLEDRIKELVARKDKQQRKKDLQDQITKAKKELKTLGR